MLEFSNLWSIFSPRSIPDPGSKAVAWSDLDKRCTALGNLYGETERTRKLTPAEMVGKDVEVYWHLDKKWYEATITAENPDGTFQVEWDENDPRYSMFKGLSEEQIQHMITEGLREIINREEDDERW